MKSITIHFFKECETLEQVKDLYKSLAKVHHPDKGGDLATMQALNNEYTFVCAKIAQGSGMSKEDIDASILSAEAYRDAIQAVIHLEGIVIEVVGAWIWLTGNTRVHKEAIKAAGYIWAHKKVAWYFRTAEYKTRNRHAMSLDDIRRKYGSETIAGRYKPSIAS